MQVLNILKNTLTGIKTWDAHYVIPASDLVHFISALIQPPGRGSLEKQIDKTKATEETAMKKNGTGEKDK